MRLCIGDCILIIIRHNNCLANASIVTYRWPGASLTIIRGHKNLHECAFIGDDSSEELEELLEVAKEQELLNINGTAQVCFFLFHKNNFHAFRRYIKYINIIFFNILRFNCRTQAAHASNIPENMKRAGQDVYFHHNGNSLRLNASVLPGYSHQLGSHELDAKTMRHILTQLFAKTLDTKKKQKENPHHHYEAVFRETNNIDKPLATITPNPEDPKQLIPKILADGFNQSKETPETDAR